MTRLGTGSLAEHVEHCRRRFLQDVLAEATAAYYVRRAETFEAAMPRKGDYVGRATPEELEQRRQRLAATALACRQRARVSLLGGEVW